MNYTVYKHTHNCTIFTKYPTPYFFYSLWFYWKERRCKLTFLSPPLFTTLNVINTVCSLKVIEILSGGVRIIKSSGEGGVKLEEMPPVNRIQ